MLFWKIKCLSQTSLWLSHMFNVKFGLLGGHGPMAPLNAAPWPPPLPVAMPLLYHPPHRQALINLEVFHPIPLACLARELLSMQGRLIYNKPRHLLKQNLSDTITQIVNSCMLSFNPSVDPVVCSYYFLMLVLIIV